MHQRLVQTRLASPPEPPSISTTRRTPSAPNSASRPFKAKAPRHRARLPGQHHDTYTSRGPRPTRKPRGVMDRGTQASKGRFTTPCCCPRPFRLSTNDTSVAAGRPRDSRPVERSVLEDLTARQAILHADNFNTHQPQQVDIKLPIPPFKYASTTGTLPPPRHGTGGNRKKASLIHHSRPFPPPPGFRAR